MGVKWGVPVPVADLRSGKVNLTSLAIERDGWLGSTQSSMTGLELPEGAWRGSAHEGQVRDDAA